jgi:hypothetical protein
LKNTGFPLKSVAGMTKNGVLQDAHDYGPFIIYPVILKKISYSQATDQAYSF